MRKLSRRQKKLIDTWFNENWTGADSITGAGDIGADLFDRIERLNNFETLWDCMNIYIMDKVMEKTLGQPQYF